MNDWVLRVGKFSR